MIDPRDFGRLEGKVDSIDGKIDRLLASMAAHEKEDDTRFAIVEKDMRRIQLQRARASGMVHAIVTLVNIGISAGIAIGAKLIHT